MNDVNIKVKIPNQWYAGFNKSNDGLPTVIMTPNGTDKASQGRINTIKRYSNGDRGIPDTVLDNNPLCGFKVVKPAQAYSTNKTVWLIEDPRGFKSEIPSGNMGQLLALTTVDHCEILESCVWARDGKDNVLLPTNSIEYQTAVKNTNLAKQSVHIAKVAIGNIVNLKNGKRNMTYLGKYYEFTGHGRGYHYAKPDAETKTHNSGNYYYRDLDNVLYHYGSGNVAEIVDANATMTAAEAEAYLNESQNEVLTSVQPVIGENFQINLLPFDLATEAANALAVFNSQANRHSRIFHKYNLVAKFLDGSMGYCDHVMLTPGWYSECELIFKKVDPVYWENGKIKTIQNSVSRSFGSRSYHETATITINLNNPLDPDVKFYEVELAWTTPHGEFRKKSRT